MKYSIHDQIEEIMERIDAAAKQYPLKSMAAEIGKAYSTLKNELSSQQGYKLGIETAMLILLVSGKLDVLDAIEDLFGRVAFQIPDIKQENHIDLLSHVSALANEFSTITAHIAETLSDGKIDKAEAKKGYKDALNLVKEAIKLQIFFKTVLEEK